MSSRHTEQESSGRALRDALALTLLLGVAGLALSYRLAEIAVPDLDEGVYLVSGKLIADGQRPYRDFLLAHPPVVPLIVAAVWAIEPRVSSLRATAIALTLISCVPLYVLARRLTSDGRAGLLAAALYIAGLVWMAGFGHTIRLEPILNLFLLGAAWAWIAGTGLSSAAVAGAGLSAAAAVKLSAILPIGFLILAETLWPVAEDHKWRRRAVAMTVGVVTLAPLAWWCLSEAGFREWTLTAQARRPWMALPDRLYELGRTFVRFPFYLAGVAAAISAGGRDRSERMRYSLVAVGATVVILVLSRALFRQYFAAALPWALLVLVDVIWRQRHLRSTAVILAFCAAGSPVLFTEMYLHVEREQLADQQRIVQRLHVGHGPLLTTAPIISLWTGRPLVPWYYVADNYLPRMAHALSDAAFAEAVERADAVVLSPSELYLARRPRTAELLTSDFRALPLARWAAWERVRVTSLGRTGQTAWNP